MIAEAVSAYSLLLANVSGDEIVHSVATVLGPLSAVPLGAAVKSNRWTAPVAPTASVLPSGLNAAFVGKPGGQTKVSTGLPVARSYRTTSGCGRSAGSGLRPKSLGLPPGVPAAAASRPSGLTTIVRVYPFSPKRWRQHSRSGRRVPHVPGTPGDRGHESPVGGERGIDHDGRLGRLEDGHLLARRRVPHLDNRRLLTKFPHLGGDPLPVRGECREENVGLRLVGEEGRFLAGDASKTEPALAVLPVAGRDDKRLAVRGECGHGEPDGQLDRRAAPGQIAVDSRVPDGTLLLRIVGPVLGGDQLRSVRRHHGSPRPAAGGDRIADRGFPVATSHTRTAPA